MNKLEFLGMRTVRLVFLLMCVSLGLTAQVNRVGVKNEWTTDLNKTNFNLWQYQALTPRDAFKAINRPKFYNEERAKENYKGDENVVVVSQGREHKAYPMEFLMFHQVINDRIGGMPIAITYCPLTDAVKVYERRFEKNGFQRELVFAPSGMIRMSNIILYDEQSESWWQQYTGKCETGELRNQQLVERGCIRMTLNQFYENCKYGLVLRFDEKDELLPYGINPYYKYDNVLTEKPLYLNHMPNERLMPMERIVTLYLRGDRMIYPLEEVRKKKVINDTPKDMYVTIFYIDGSKSMLEEREIKQSKVIGSAVAYSALYDGVWLTFSYKNGYYIDEQSQSEWNMMGECIKGHFKGGKLTPISTSQSFAFPELEFYSNSLIYSINW
ncbi:DUF3179 domain-containing protein [Flammeovirga yaeyamensis]|uniref:DUF3179 domain-containing protein n=1 Tax=Flammeovirga yaeyamensis TaxID=367791 RepID=A0AAX1N613_9BACT|nr:MULTISPECIES: DUF3179 domain-containing (seleno)protein [Flammeovirga]ANQ49491.1 DUF3179 domain-containing protein [Flammeovirga sp. MY04]MBB3697607.1 hypothetical protein [Flammeovirga yaeyamensis]NMF36297.1 DUF3179 domain-containing protein [Flammeovirga yaeyamensis]QWG03024.1 DUF3179 domain-containing protein [Flammeovirga yaeyamensis]